MSRVAVDVVLLPERTMMERLIRINRRLVGDSRAEIVLGTDTRLPHISLAMGVMEQTEMDTMRKLLARLAEQAAVRQLRLAGILISPNSRGETVSVLEVEKTPELQALHEQAMRAMEPLLGREVTAEMVADEVVAPTTLDWIRDYPTKASFGRFAPHITIGYGQVQADLSFPYSFAVSRLALCHLGNHCTCRRLLLSARLS